MSRLVNAIRGALLPGTMAAVLAADIEDLPDADASIHELPLAEANSPGGDMSVPQTAPGAAAAATGALAAVTAAASGGSDGFKAAMDRVNAIVSAATIKGDGPRVSAALELAVAAPGMSAEAVVAFVASHVPAAKAGEPEPATDTQPAAGAPEPPKATQSYGDRRAAAAAPLARPGGGAGPAPSATIDRSAIFSARRNQMKGA